jgi:hypothetical protein
MGRFLTTRWYPATRRPAPVPPQSEIPEPSVGTKLLADHELLEAHVVQNTHPGGHQGEERAGWAMQVAGTQWSTNVAASLGSRAFRVVDASIFPTLMRAGLNVPVIMAAEKAAAMIANRRNTAPFKVRIEEVLPIGRRSITPLVRPRYHAAMQRSKRQFWHQKYAPDWTAGLDFTVLWPNISAMCHSKMNAHRKLLIIQ